MQTLGSLRYRRFWGEWFRLGRDLLRMQPRRRSHVSDVRSVGLTWMFFLIYCQFCQLYSSDYITTFRINHPTMSQPTIKTFCFLFRSKWPKQHVLQWSPNCRSKFWAFTHTVELTWIVKIKGNFCLLHTFYQVVGASPKRTSQIYGDFPSLVRSPGLARYHI